MTIDNGTPTSPPNTPKPGLLEGSRKCPYCVPDRSVPGAAVPNESQLLERFLGTGVADQESQS